MDETRTVDIFDRAMGALIGRPDVTASKETSIMNAKQIVGDTQQFFVQTYREREAGDTIFVTCVSRESTIRLAIPPRVADAIARQRDTLTAKTRSKAAKANAQARKDRGELPGFMRKKKKG